MRHLQPILDWALVLILGFALGFVVGLGLVGQ